MNIPYRNPIENPCRKNCPQRKAGCAIHCEAWNNYIAKRDEYYKKKLRDSELNVKTYASKTKKREIMLIKKRRNKF